MLYSMLKMLSLSLILCWRRLEMLKRLGTIILADLYALTSDYLMINDAKADQLTNVV